jgi:gamma-glutamyl:cysteine ligase YbdK (ATP-grasp superfamily)
MLKRKSLAELQREDDQLGTARPEGETLAPAAADIISEIVNNKSAATTKADFVKMSITVEPEIFDAVDELSRQRRKNKQPFTFSAIIRDALKEYLGKPERS